jgi:hypothetical protein
MWVVIHKCMETMLGITQYSYFYLKLTKMLCLSYRLCFLFNKIGEEGRAGSAWKQGGLGEMEGAGERDDPNNIYTYE